MSLGLHLQRCLGEEPCSRQPSAARRSGGTHGSELRVIWHGEKLGVRLLRKEEE